MIWVTMTIYSYQFRRLGMVRPNSLKLCITYYIASGYKFDLAKIDMRSKKSSPNDFHLIF